MHKSNGCVIKTNPRLKECGELSQPSDVLKMMATLMASVVLHRLTRTKLALSDLNSGLITFSAVQLI